jgi:hypothetical protein
METPQSRSTEPLTAAERAAFERDGFVRIPGAFARADAERMQGEWWAELAETIGARRDDPASWPSRQLDLKRPKRATSERCFQAPRVAGALDAILGEGAWDWPGDWGRPIVTFPSGAPLSAWDVPTGWHWDGRTSWNVERPITLFVVAFIAEVETGGGGTTVVAGSHRLLIDGYQPLPATVRALGDTWRRDRLVRDHPRLAELCGHAAFEGERGARFMSEAGDLRVVELTGEPGDMVFCHPLLIHAQAPNCRTMPRMMRIKQQLMSREARRMGREEAAGR